MSCELQVDELRLSTVLLSFVDSDFLVLLHFVFKLLTDHLGVLVREEERLGFEPLVRLLFGLTPVAVLLRVLAVQ